MRLRDEKIEILETAVEIDRYGNHRQTKRVILTCWAYIRQTSSTEYFAAAQTNQTEEMVFEIAMRDGLDSKRHSIRYRTLEYDITRIDQFDRRRRSMKIYAKRARD